MVLRSRRDGRAADATALALCLTGTHAAVLTQDHEGGPWTGRARVDLATSHPRAARLTRSPTWLEDLQVGHDGVTTDLVAGGFGQLGLRDLRLVTHADGRPYDDGSGRLHLTATSAGPGPFGTGHSSVWALDPARLGSAAGAPESGALTHTADLFVRRRGSSAVLGDHAGHLLRVDDAWLLATSTWGDFDPDRHDASVAVTLAETGADLLHGVHVVPGEPLPLPTDDPSVGVWDPHLLRTDDGWLVGYVSATRFFRFHPVIAEGPDLDSLRLRAADPFRRPSCWSPTAPPVRGRPGGSGRCSTSTCAPGACSRRRTRPTSRGPRWSRTARTGCWSPSTTPVRAGGCADTAPTATSW